MSNDKYSDSQPGVKMSDLKPEDAPRATATGPTSTVALDPQEKNEPKVPPDTDPVGAGASQPAKDRVTTAK